ncbi:MAG: kynureninase [Bacteroidota bacterium]
MTLEYARSLDAQDPLRSYRERFYLPRQPNGEPHLYFTGNSLGCQPRSVRAYVEQELLDWQNLGVEGHFHAKHPWMPYHEFLTQPMARIVGAKPAEVVMMNGLTVNLHLMMASFYRPSTQRFKILIEADAFPSDIYAVKSQLEWHGFSAEKGLIALTPRSGEHALRTEDILQAIAGAGAGLALVLLGGVNYYTGQFFDLAKIAAATHAQGAVAGVDLAHAVGNVPLQLHDWGFDFACWCTYKYLNGGPGSVAGCFVHERHHQDHSLPRLAGWWGHDKATRFQMGPDFMPIPSAEGWQLSNAPVLSMASLRASLDLFEEVGMDAIREKSIALTNFFEQLLREKGSHLELNIITPSDPKQRGAQLSLLTGPAGRAWFEHLTRSGVIVDWREPKVIRAAPAPLYNSFEDVWRFVEILSTA